MFDTKDFTPVGKPLTASCMEAVASGCGVEITIATCNLSRVFSTLTNTLKLGSEWGGLEGNFKTKEESFRSSSSHREKITSISWDTSIPFDACAPENQGFKDYVLQLMNAGNEALKQFMNNAVVFITSYDGSVLTTTKYNAQINSLGGFLGYDGDGINETEIEVTLYGNPQVINQKKSKIKFDFDVVAEAQQNMYKVQNATFLDKTQEELCDFTPPFAVTYVGSFEATDSACVDDRLKDIIATQLYTLKSTTGAAIQTLIGPTWASSPSSPFSSTQFPGYTLKQVYAVILRTDGVYELLARVPLPTAALRVEEE